MTFPKGKSLLFQWACIVVLCTMIYALIFESFRIRVREMNAGEPFSAFFKEHKTIFISDIHASFFGIREKLLLRKIREISPDIILLGGDYATWYGAYDRAFAFLGNLKAREGVFGVLGDVDYYDSRKSCRFCHTFDSTSKPLPVRFLRDETVFVPYGGSRMAISGVETFHENGLPPKTTDIPPGTLPEIVLTHKQIDLQGLPDRPVLILSGDTHGGQIFLPDILWQIIFGKSKGPVREGMVKEGQKRLVVSTGIGTNKWPVRFFCPPEIVLFKGE